LIHEVDARNGWQLQDKTEEVQRVKRQTKARVRQLTCEHKQAVNKMARETTTELEVAKDKHETDMTKLLHQKEALVERAKEHRKVHKVAMAGAAEKQDALSILCSAVECANQKLVRNLNAERVKGEGLLQRTSLMEMEVTELAEVRVACVAAEKEAAIANKAKVALTKAVEQGRNRATAAKVILNQTHKEATKVRECPTSIYALLYSYISFAFQLSFSLHS
jgi:hypothetical protein